MPSGLVVGGDQPFVRRLIGVSISPMVGSIYNMGVWDNSAAAWVNVATRRTLDGEATAKKFCWGWCWVPSGLVVGGDQPFVRRLIRVSISPMVGSIYNMGVWDKSAAAWVNVATRHTLDGEATARRRYKETGRSLDNGGCVGEPHIMVDRCVVFLCILHCSIAIGRLRVAFIEARLVDPPKENAEAVQWVLYRARTGVKLGALATPDGEEACALFLAWEEIGPLLDYVPEDGGWQAVVAMRDLLRDLYTDKPPCGDPRAAEVARAYRAHCCKESCQSNHLLYL